jgi:GTPase SAR1 family protein
LVKNTIFRDTAGDENFFCFREVSCKDADVVLICFSMVDDRSLQSAMEKWFPQTQEYCPSAEKILVGTKEDLHREYEMDPKTE